MAAQYTAIPEAEMVEFLTERGFKPVFPPRTQELVFGKRVKQDDYQLTLRVYTSITRGVARGVGEDAIRVSLFLRTPDGQNIVKLAGDKRVHRVANWRKNLQNRLDGWLEHFPKHKCSVCGLPMIPRTQRGTKKQFLGCSNFPKCSFTLPMPKEN